MTLKIFSKNKTIHAQRDKLFSVIEKLTNIVLVNSRNNNNQLAKKIIGELRNLFYRFFRLRKTDSHKFNTLLLSEDFYENYAKVFSRSAKLDREDSKDIETVEYRKLKEQSNLELLFRSDQSLQGLTRFLQSFEKIWIKALFDKNQLISNYVYYLLKNILEQLVVEQDSEIYINQLLKLFRNVVWDVIREIKDDKKIDPIICLASVSWYIDIVFNKTVDSFDRKYLYIFDKYFFSLMTTFVSENRKNLFKNVVKYSIDRGIHIADNFNDIYDYAHIMLRKDFKKYEKIDSAFNIEQKCDHLIEMAKMLYTEKQLAIWNRSFDDLTTIINQNLEQSDKERAQIYEDAIKKSAEARYKSNNLKGIYFKIGAFCLFKSRYSFIRYLWNYKQPADSETIWVGNDIVSDNLTDLISLYFNFDPNENEFLIWEDHHGSKKYKEQYFLLLLARLLQQIPTSESDKHIAIERFHYPDFDTQKSSEIKYSIDRLYRVLDNLIKDQSLLSKLEVIDIDELFNTIKLFLVRLSELATKKIDKDHITNQLSEKSISEFISDVLNEFKKSRQLQHILCFYNAFECSSSLNSEKDIQRFGISKLDDRAIFFENWHKTFLNFGKSYGHSLGLGEDYHFFNEIANLCITIRLNTINDIVNNLKEFNNLIIISSGVVIWKYFEKSIKFKPKWAKDIVPVDLSEFEGFFNIHNIPIPVFSLNNTGSDNEILVLNYTKLGKLTQYSPLNDTEDPKFKHDMLYINIEDLSKNSEEIDKLINHQLDWLKQKGNVDQQKEYLKQVVRILIYEKIAFQKADDFIGYRFKLDF